MLLSWKLAITWFNKHSVKTALFGGAPVTTLSFPSRSDRFCRVHT